MCVGSATHIGLRSLDRPVQRSREKSFENILNVFGISCSKSFFSPTTYSIQSSSPLYENISRQYIMLVIVNLLHGLQNNNGFNRNISKCKKEINSLLTSWFTNKTSTLIDQLVEDLFILCKHTTPGFFGTTKKPFEFSEEAEKLLTAFRGTTIKFKFENELFKFLRSINPKQFGEYANTVRITDGLFLAQLANAAGIVTLEDLSTFAFAAQITPGELGKFVSMVNIQVLSVGGSFLKTDKTPRELGTLVSKICISPIALCNFAQEIKLNSIDDLGEFACGAYNQISSNLNDRLEKKYAQFALEMEIKNITDLRKFALAAHISSTDLGKFARAVIFYSTNGIGSLEYLAKFVSEPKLSPENLREFISGAEIATEHIAQFAFDAGITTNEQAAKFMPPEKGVQEVIIKLETLINQLLPTTIALESLYTYDKTDDYLNLRIIFPKIVLWEIVNKILSHSKEFESSISTDRFLKFLRYANVATTTNPDIDHLKNLIRFFHPDKFNSSEFFQSITDSSAEKTFYTILTRALFDFIIDKHKQAQEDK